MKNEAQMMVNLQCAGCGSAVSVDITEFEDLLQKVIFDLLSDLADVVENMEKELGL